MKTVPMAGAANANVQNQINVSLIFNFLRSHGETYRADIARNVGLSAPAVSRAVESLIDQGYIAESGTLITESGKKVSRIDVNPDKGGVVAVDLMKGRSKFGYFDFTGQSIHQTRGTYFVETDDISGDLIGQIRKFIGEVKSGDFGRSIPEIEAICLGVPCAVDPVSGITTGAWLYDFLIGVNLKNDLEAVFDLPVFVENDIKLAAFAENRLGEGKHHRHLVYVDINDYGIGSGIILDNHIVRGALGLAGEIGYSVVPGAKTDRGAGSKGFLESEASLEALIRKVVSRLEAGERSSLDGRVPVARDIFEAASEGDDLCCDVIRRSVELLATVAVNLVLAVNPEVFVVGGDVFDMPGAKELVLDPLQRRMEEVLPFEPPIIEFSMLGSNACVTGAALFGVESILLGKYPFAFDYVSSGDTHPLRIADQ